MRYVDAMRIILSSKVEEDKLRTYIAENKANYPDKGAYWSEVQCAKDYAQKIMQRANA